MEIDKEKRLETASLVIDNDKEDGELDEDSDDMPQVTTSNKLSEESFAQLIKSFPLQFPSDSSSSAAVSSTVMPGLEFKSAVMPESVLNQPDDDDDEDDDEYGISSKRLKIDESDTTLALSQAAAVVVTVTVAAEQVIATSELSNSSAASSSHSSLTVMSNIYSGALSMTSRESSKNSGVESSANDDSNQESDKKPTDESVLNAVAPKLKVPPLKIICANPNGGLPYIKTPNNGENKRVNYDFIRVLLLKVV
jgi:hypothetical protein